MVEAQAIARVNRLGQKRNVRVVRYIMKGTVEEVRFSLMIECEKMTEHYSWNCKHSKYASWSMRKLGGKRTMRRL
jgi:hypothetical protein